MPTTDTTVTIDIAQCTACMEALVKHMTTAKQKPWPGRHQGDLQKRLVARAVHEAGNTGVLWAEIVSLCQLAAYGMAVDWAIEWKDARGKKPAWDGQQAADMVYHRLFTGATWTYAPAVATILKGAVELAERI